MKIHEDRLMGYQVIERTRLRRDLVMVEVQRLITQIIYKAELWFLCMTHRLIVLYNCMKFHLNSFNGCQLTERTSNSIANDQRKITQKYPKQRYGSCA